MAGLSLVVAKVLESVVNNSKGSGATLTGLLKTASRYPIKVVVMVLTSPYLLCCVVVHSKILRRKVVAGLGLFVSILLALLSFTFLGTVMGAVAVGSYLGVLWGIGAFFGTMVSWVLNVVFAAVVLMGFSTFFLFMSAEDANSLSRSVVAD
ncbi:hypothetical protein [Pseudomonas sp. GV071]|uniref:hypothetical protein n=1 Tax=Pseudomonas sp. GV071 TaxID=2135754 RepID=UPI000D38A55D|nr:hypothetical protein [Pseudomonas sp. GV071]PTQ68514.1 hypothetical protein C8K61_111142 [Pseudomonas sp. GV071]